MPKAQKAVKPTSKDKDTLVALSTHYNVWNQDNDQRRNRPNGWDDVLRAYFGYIPSNWPYLSEVSDPVIRTVILEKTARLFNGKLRGRLVPREGGDAVKAKVHNALLEYQWDKANNSGSMLEKWALMDMQTRIFGTSFALAYWCVKEEGDKVVFEGNEFKVLDNRDVGVDYTADHVKNANWVQVREYKQLEELEEENENYPTPIYKNLDILRDKMSLQKGATNMQGNNNAGGGDPRSSKYPRSIVKQIRGLEDRVGKDRSFPVVEVVTEYQKDRWITYAPRYNLILRDIDNPYNHKKIPIVQLRYYPVGDDVYGESEVEAVLPIYWSIQATLCGFIDQMNLTMKPPIKLANNATIRKDTIIYGPNALWLVGDSINNVAVQQSGGEHIANFQNAYTALKSAFNTAMGELSQGTSNLQPQKQGDTTATEIKDLAQQRQSRDQYNQLYLEEALKDQMMFWVANNQQFLFDDPSKETMILRIVGKDTIKDFQNMGLDAMETPDEALGAVKDLVGERFGDMQDAEMEMMMKETEMPRYPVIMNPKAKNPLEYDIKPKLEVDKEGEFATLNMTRDDFDPSMVLDFVPDVSSMSASRSMEMMQGRNQALQLILNPAVQQGLAADGVRPAVKEILTQVLEDLKINNAEKLFERIQQPQAPSGAFNAAGAGAIQLPQAAPGGQVPPRMAAGGIPPQ